MSTTYIIVIGIILIVLSVVYVAVQRIIENRTAYTIEHISYEEPTEDYGSWKVEVPDKSEHEHDVYVFRTADGVLHRSIK